MKFLNAKSLALCGLAVLIGVTTATHARADWDRRGPQPYYGYIDHERARYEHREHREHRRWNHPPAYRMYPQPRVVYVPTPMPPPVYAAPVYYPYGWTFAFNFR